jgi:hypothetical protein
MRMREKMEGKEGKKESRKGNGVKEEMIDGKKGRKEEDSEPRSFSRFSRGKDGFEFGGSSQSSRFVVKRVLFGEDWVAFVGSGFNETHLHPNHLQNFK